MHAATDDKKATPPGRRRGWLFNVRGIHRGCQKISYVWSHGSTFGYEISTEARGQFAIPTQPHPS